METTHAALMHEAISPECDDENTGRSDTRCRIDGEDILEITLEASDLSALRAALNTWLRLVQVASEMIDRTQI